MYASSVVEQRLEFAKQELGYWPEYHSPSEVDEFERQLERRFTDEYKLARSEASGSDDPAKTFQTRMLRSLSDPQTPKLTAHDVRFIENERALVQCDAAYGLTRYCWVSNRENRIERFNFYGAQKILFSVIAELEAKGACIEILIAKARKLGMCLDPNTRVLTSDLRWVRIEEIKVGDKLVSVDEASAPSGHRSHRTMKETVVEARREVFDHAIRVVADNGQSFIATAKHRFLCKRRGGVDSQWRKVGELVVGDEIRYITTPWDAPDYEDGWFSGIIDGEGSLRPKIRAGSELCIAQTEGAVLDRARNYLQQRNYTFREEIDRRQERAGFKTLHKLTLGRMNEIFRLIGQTRPSRMLEKTWWQGKGLPGKKSGFGWSRVVSIELLPMPQRMIDLQTSEKTFIAEGFVSHNSTLVELLMLLKAAWGEGVNGVIASADRDITKKMVKMVFLAYDRMPWWIRPVTSRRVESDNGMIVFGGINAGLGFQHGKQTNPIAMGDTPVAYHLSEVSSYANAHELIDIGLFKAVFPSTRVLGVLESTCKGDTGWWADSYWEAKEQWKQGMSRLMALFLPFYVAEEMYPSPTERHTHPIPANWKPEPETRKMMAESSLYVQSNDVLSRVLAPSGRPYEVPREKAWYWEWNYMSARRHGTEKSWFQEMPHTDQAAFQGSYDNVFGREVIAEVFTQRQTRYEVYGIVGQSIEERHEPPADEVDYSATRMPVRFNSRKGEVYRWEFIPLQWEEPFVELEEIRNFDNHMGKLFVYLPPERGYRYSIGVDTSAGTGSDGSVIAVCRLGRTPQERDEQAAEWRSNLVGHVEAYAWAMAIAAYYSRYGNDLGPRWSNPLVAVEQVAAVGDTVQLQMRQMGYTHFFKPIRYDNASKYMKKANAHKEGWFTTGITRPIITNTFVTLVQNDWYKVNSPYTAWEMQHWEVHLTGRGVDKFEHSTTSTDDGIFANAMAAFCPRDLEPLAERANTKWRGSNGVTGPKLDVTPTNGGILFPTTGSDPPKERDLRRILR